MKNSEKYDYLIFNPQGKSAGSRFEFEGFSFKCFLNYLEISVLNQPNLKVLSPLCGLSKKETLARIYEGNSSILGFDISVKKIDTGASLFLVDNLGFSHSNKQPDFFGGIIQENFETPTEYMMRHQIANPKNQWWEFLKIDGVECLVNMETEEKLSLIDPPRVMGIRQAALDEFAKWIGEEFGKKEQSWFNQWGKNLLVVNP